MMHKSQQMLVAQLRNERQTMVTQLHQFCEINSGSDNIPGLSRMHDALHQAFSPIADTIQSHAFPPITTIAMNGKTVEQNLGQALFISKRPHCKRRILFSGHMDTVYSATHPFQTLTYLDDDRINGPGVADMKGGLIVILHALTAFETLPEAAQIGWDVLINADEELGSPASQSLLQTLAQTPYEAALVYEPALTPLGTLAKNRKGSGQLTLIATGKAAHAGRAFYEGRNAICYLAEAIIRIHALNGQREGVTINVGKIAGGEALNVVPEKALAKLDIRIEQPEDEHWVRQQLNTIVQNLQRKDYTLSVHGQFKRPVKRVNAATKRLFSRLKHHAETLNIPLDWQDCGGCCDGNNLAEHGLAVLDSLGVRGGAIHSSDEFILLDSLVERATLSALLLLDCGQNPI